MCAASHSSLDGYCSTVQGLLDWFEVDLGSTELLFIQINLCVLCVFVLLTPFVMVFCTVQMTCTSSPLPSHKKKKLIMFVAVLFPPTSFEKKNRLVDLWVGSFVGCGWVPF